MIISLVENSDPDEMYGCIIADEDEVPYNHIHNDIVDILNEFKDNCDNEWTIEDLIATLQEKYNIQYVPIYKFKEIPI